MKFPSSSQIRGILPSPIFPSCVSKFASVTPTETAQMWTGSWVQGLALAPSSRFCFVSSSCWVSTLSWKLWSLLLLGRSARDRLRLAEQVCWAPEHHAVNHMQAVRVGLAYTQQWASVRVLTCFQQAPGLCSHAFSPTFWCWLLEATGSPFHREMLNSPAFEHFSWLEYEFMAHSWWFRKIGVLLSFISLHIKCSQQPAPVMRGSRCVFLKGWAGWWDCPLRTVHSIVEMITRLKLSVFSIRVD